MRPLLVLALLFALAVPAYAAPPRLNPGDGTLSVKNGAGMVAFRLARGAIVGRFTTGVLVVDRDDPNDDCAALQVWGAEVERERPIRDEFGELVGVRCSFIGTNVRFRFVGGPQRVHISRARDIDLSAVGLGRIFMDGAGGADGTFDLNELGPESLPDELTRLRLGTPPPLPPLPS